MSVGLGTGHLVPPILEADVRSLRGSPRCTRRTSSKFVTPCRGAGAGRRSVEPFLCAALER